ncbi:MAG: hypothetical protein H0Z28_12310 [Archaeoglobus sp.]|nr:hypothetical protein [Archaeoglobus sp.]
MNKKILVVLLALLVITVVLVVNSSHHEAPETEAAEEEKNKVVLDLTASGGVLLREVSVAFAAFLILLLGFTLPFWMNALFRKIAVDDRGITFKRGLNFKIPVLYEFDRFYAYDDLEWIKAKWIFVDIKGKAAFASPRWIIVRDKRGFIKAIQKFAPELVEGG